MAGNHAILPGQDLDDIDEIIRPLLQGDHSIQDQNIDQQFLQGLQPEQNLKINVLDLKNIYDKVQKKTISGSEQRIAGGVVNIEITTTAQITQIGVNVRRCQKAAEKTNDNTGAIPLPVSIQNNPLSDKIYLAVDLDAVYKTQSGSFIYYLDRVEVEQRNVWELVFVVDFIDGTRHISLSKPFRIRTKPRPNTARAPEQSPEMNGPNGENDPLIPPDNKRKRTSNSTSSYGTNPSPFSASSTNSPGMFKPYHGPTGFDGESPSSTETSEAVVIDYLQAQRAEIQNLRVRRMISSPNADIAYHLQLQGPYYRKHPLEEGDVVGLYENKEKGTTEIALFSMDNAQEARMGGVISRSAYLHGNVPDENIDETDTVCVIGIVGIKVSGPIQNGERIYASTEKPGVGIPETQIPLRAHGKVSPILLGQALESSNSSSLDSVHRVKSFVSIVLGIQSQQINSALEDVRRDTRNRIAESIKREKRKFYRSLLCKGSIILMILAILTAVLYEVFSPGSWLRYAICRSGSIDHHEMWFTYTTPDYQTPRVHGIEFTWEKLKDKMDLHFRKFNRTGMHYYLNLDRCAYGGVITVRSHLDHTPQVRGAEVFAVNSICTRVFYELKGNWHNYTSARDLKCVPPKQ